MANDDDNQEEGLSTREGMEDEPSRHREGLRERLSHLQATMEETKARFGSTSPLSMDLYLDATRGAEGASGGDAAAGEGGQGTENLLVESDAGPQRQNGGAGNIHDISNFVTRLTAPSRPRSPVSKIQGGLPSRHCQPTYHKQERIKKWRPTREMELESQIQTLLETTIDRQQHFDIVADLENDIERRRESYLRREREMAYENEELRGTISAMEDRLRSLQDGVQCSSFKTDVKALHRQVLENIDTIQKQSLQSVQYEEGELLVAFQSKLRQIESDLRSHKVRYTERPDDTMTKIAMLRDELEVAHTIAGKLDQLYRESSSQVAQMKITMDMLEDEKMMAIENSVRHKRAAESLRRKVVNLMKESTCAVCASTEGPSSTPRRHELLSLDERRRRLEQADHYFEEIEEDNSDGSEGDEAAEGPRAAGATTVTDRATSSLRQAPQSAKPTAERRTRAQRPWSAHGGLKHTAGADESVLAPERAVIMGGTNAQPVQVARRTTFRPRHVASARLHRPTSSRPMSARPASNSGCATTKEADSARARVTVRKGWNLYV